MQNNGSQYPLVHRRFRLHSMPLKIRSLGITECIDRDRAAGIQCQLWIFTPHIHPALHVLVKQPILTFNAMTNSINAQPLMDSDTD